MGADKVSSAKGQGVKLRCQYHRLLTDYARNCVPRIGSVQAHGVSLQFAEDFSMGLFADIEPDYLG